MTSTAEITWGTWPADTCKSTAASRQAAAKSEWYDAAFADYLAADNQTRGNMLNRRGIAAGIDAFSLWSGTDRRMRAYASEELVAWFDEHPRVTVTEYVRQAREARPEADNCSAEIAAVPSEFDQYLNLAKDIDLDLDDYQETHSAVAADATNDVRHASQVSPVRTGPYIGRRRSDSSRAAGRTVGHVGYVGRHRAYAGQAQRRRTTYLGRAGEDHSAKAKGAGCEPMARTGDLAGSGREASGMTKRHSWDYHGNDPYVARQRTCKRCGTMAKTFGVGAGRIWEYVTPAGQHSTRAPVCQDYAIKHNLACTINHYRH